jgi:hypothetical protein
MVALIPRRRSSCRLALELYALSASRFRPTPPGRAGGLGVLAEQGSQGVAAIGRFPLDLLERPSCPLGQVALALLTLDVAVDGRLDGVRQAHLVEPSDERQLSVDWIGQT